MPRLLSLVLLGALSGCGEGTFARDLPDASGSGVEGDTSPDTDSEADTDSEVDTEADRDTEPDVDTQPDTDPPSPWDVFTNPSCIGEHAHILRLYPSFLGRDPDVAGANHWLSELTNGDATLTEIQNAFGTSVEFQAQYAGLSNTAFVTEVYDNVLGCGPDSEGLT